MVAMMYPDVALWEALLLLVGGLWGVSWSADRFVDGAAALAARYRVSSFVIGVVIVGFGTSLPELAVSAFSSGANHAALALGNAYGSNIYNVAVILGLMAMIRPLRVRRSIRCFAVPILLAAGFVSWIALIYLEALPRWAALLLILLFVYLVRLLMTDRAMPRGETPDRVVPHPWWVASWSLLMLLVTSHFVVWGAVVTARQMGVSELVLGLTVVAAGTSLPELVTSVVALRRRQTDLILGNIIGSNLFNTLAVVGVSGLIRPVAEVPHMILLRDLPLMIVLSMMLCTRRLTRRRALVWLLGFAAYLWFLL